MGELNSDTSYPELAAWHFIDCTASRFFGFTLSSQLLRQLMMNKVFVSYRQESDQHRQKVLEFARQLQAEGISVELDQLYFQAHSGGPPEGWPKWCEDRVTQGSSQKTENKAR